LCLARNPNIKRKSVVQGAELQAERSLHTLCTLVLTIALVFCGTPSEERTYFVLAICYQKTAI
jgi:hypothetical protein